MSSRSVRVRVVGVLVAGDRVFVQRKTGDEYWALPGGGLKFGETLVEGLQREFQEEFACPISVGRRLEVLENFFTLDRELHHSIEIYFEVQPTGDQTIQACEPDLESTWLPLSASARLRPEGILNRLGVA